MVNAVTLKLRRAGIDVWSVGAVVIAAIVAAPLLAVLWLALTPGEPIWQLPLAEEFYMDDIRSWNADIKNVGGGWAGTITAALFLKCFVGETPWAHLDIAGPAFAEGPRPYSPRGGTGFGVRTLVSYIDSI